MKGTRSAPYWTSTTTVTRLSSGRKSPSATGVMAMRFSSSSRQTIRRLMHSAYGLTKPFVRHSKGAIHNSLPSPLFCGAQEIPPAGHPRIRETRLNVVHLRGRHVEVGTQCPQLLVGQLVAQARQCGVHRRDPRIASLFRYAKRRVAHS